MSYSSGTTTRFLPILSFFPPQTPTACATSKPKNLDEETNLKPRKSVKATSNLTSEDDIERSSFSTRNHPSKICTFAVAFCGEQRQELISINELLLRGHAIRNMQWIIGLVVFTSVDTMETNFNVIINFIVLLAMCSISAVFNGLEDAKTGTSVEFFEVNSDATDSHILNALITFASCLIAFQNIVPILLYISIKIVKTIQACFISQDADMYYKPSATPCSLINPIHSEMTRTTSSTAESLDEAALVAAARDVGFPFVRKTKDGMDIEVMGQMEHWTTLKVLESNTTRSV
ncbi:hypothetical protein BDZ89DRAFT_1118487 [Hymenopellis radicata]|nr:hypothetical protein BDZ89DRAFT_1118487 [Hymenopellis radicata]